MGTTMYDSVDVGALPKDAKWVAGHVCGDYKNFAELRARFPRARHVSICVDAKHAADVLDVEKGAATPADVPAWIEWMRRLHRRPTVYTSKDNLTNVVTELQRAKVDPPFWWIADWNDLPHLVPGSVATQYASPITEPSLHYDVSYVSPNFPHSFTFQRSHMFNALTSSQPVASLARQAAGITGIVAPLAGTINGPKAWISMGLGGLLLLIEHYVSDPSTGSNPPPAA